MRCIVEAESVEQPEALVGGCTKSKPLTDIPAPRFAVPGAITNFGSMVAAALRYEVATNPFSKEPQRPHIYIYIYTYVYA